MIKYFINNLPFYSFSLFLFLFPISERLSTILLLLMGFITIIHIKKINLKLLKSFIYILSFYIVYVFLEFLYTGVIFNSNTEQKASFVMFPLFFSTFVFNIKESDLLIKSLLYGCIVSVLVIAVNTFLVENLSGFEKIESKIYNTKDFFFNSFDWQVIIDPIYQSLLYIISLAYIIYRKPFSKKTNIILMFSLMIGIYFTQSAFGLLTLIILLIYHFLRSKPFLFYLSISLFVLFVFISGLYKHIMGTRTVLWENAIKLIYKNPIFGYGSVNAQNAIDNSFFKVFIDSDSIYLNTGLNTHNQYLQFFLEGGLLFFIVFLMLFVPFFNRTKFFSNNRFYELIGLVFLLIMLIECIFERYIGIAVFSVFYCLIINLSFGNEKDN